MKKHVEMECLEAEITLGGQPITYTIRRSLKAKNVRFVIREESGLEVVIPADYPLKNIDVLLSQREKWILDKLKLMEENAQIRQAAQDDALSAIRYLGKEYPVVVILDHASPIRVELSGEKALLTLPQNREEMLRQVIDAWYRWAAKSLFSERAAYWAEKMHVTYQNLFIRNQKTRWGSCSKRKNLSFNMRIVMAPPEVVDYIIIHELAHLKEMNHSKKFWQVVETYCPDYKRHLAWLKKFGPGLTL